MDGRPFTYGEKATGYNSNPSPLAVEKMEMIRKKYADLIDEIYNDHINPTIVRNGEVVAMAKLSIRHLQESSYWTIKAITWKD